MDATALEDTASGGGTDGSSISTMRLYGAVIALVSGTYSIYLSTTGIEMTTGAWLMAVLGGIVVVHGIVLVTPAIRTLGAYSGPLMLLYSLLMLLNQLRLATTATGMDVGMGSGMNDGMTTGTRPGMDAGMADMVGVDPGMIAIAGLMLASGIIMTSRSAMMRE